MRFLRGLGVFMGTLAVLYGICTAALYWTMRQPLDRFGAVMRHVPGVAMAVLPFEPLWMRVRAGTLKAGDTAPDFDLPTLDRSRHVRMSDEYRDRPVVLIFGSYT